MNDKSLIKVLLKEWNKVKINEACFSYNTVTFEGLCAFPRILESYKVLSAKESLLATQLLNRFKPVKDFNKFWFTPPLVDSSLAYQQRTLYLESISKTLTK